MHCVKSVRIWSYSGPYFPALGLNTEIYEVQINRVQTYTLQSPNLRILSKRGKIRTRKLQLRTLFTQ